MAAKVSASLFCALALASAACHADEVGRHRYTPVQHLKNYALSACLADGYQSAEVVGDATASANGYKELGSLDIDAYNEALVLVRKYLARTYPSQSGEKLVLMKCIDLFHSRELDRLARKHARMP